MSVCFIGYPWFSMVTFTPLQVFLKSPETCPIHQGLIPQGEHLPTDHPLKLAFVRRFGLTHKLLRRKDLLD